jgi:hypothetical protein
VRRRVARVTLDHPPLNLLDATLLDDLDRAGARARHALRRPRSNRGWWGSGCTSSGCIQITAENIDMAFAHMKEDLPGQMAGVDAFLNQPA